MREREREREREKEREKNITFMDIILNLKHCYNSNVDRFI